jgi:Tol biopolymer transport system component
MTPARFAVLFCATVALPAAAQVTRVSVSTAGVQADLGSWAPAVSADGRFVVFYSFASNLVDGDTNGLPDVFLRDRDTDADGMFDEAGAVATTRLNLGPGGAQSSGGFLEGRPAITPDGRYVTFVSSAPNLLPGADPLVSSLYRLDRQTNTLIRVADRVTDYAISADGDIVAIAGVRSLDVIEIAAGRRTAISPPEVPDFDLPLQVIFGQIGLSADGRWVSAVRVRAYTFRVEPTEVV